jgi:lactate dehydrogenase-like 2-hydroxyacid dehydrogenase
MGVGYDYIDVPFATEHGVLICNTANVSTDSVADLTFGLILGVARRIVQADAYVKSGAWARQGQMRPLATDLRGTTLGLLGLGRIGQAVARRAAGFGMEVLYYDPFRNQAAEGAGLARYAERDEVIRGADFLSLHLFLDDTTRKGFGRREFGMMKPTAYLINASRGQTVEQDALIEALQEKRIAGAGLDVFEVEPLSGDSPLAKLDNVILTPHAAGDTEQAHSAMFERAGRNIAAAVNGRPAEAMVNSEALKVREQIEVKA